MKIIGLEVDNVKRLKAIELMPQGNVIVIKGDNGEGKSSLLDAIWYALEWKAGTKATPKPIRDGESKASVRLDLGKYIVTRKWTAKGSSIKLEGPNGEQYKSPQALLDNLIGDFSFDPFGWSMMDAKGQRKTLLSLIDLGFDLDAHEAERKGVFDQRTVENRNHDTAKKLVGDMDAPAEGLPEEEVSAGDLIDELTAARQHNLEVEQRASKIEAVQLSITKAKEYLERSQEELKILEASPADAKNTVSLQVQLDDLEGTNRAVREAKLYRERKVTEVKLRRKCERLTGELTALDEKRDEALAAAKLPVDGLGFDEDGVTYLGQPFVQASSAEKLRVSMAVAMAVNPELRVLRITDGSLLDEKNMELIQEMAEGHDYQVWIERVGKGGVGVLIEDGEIADET